MFRNEPKLTGSEVLDEHGHKLGKITDVLFDEQAMPKWAVVDPGLLHRQHFAPLQGSYQTDEGAVVLAVDGRTVKHGPAAPRDHVLTRDLEEALEDYFHLQPI